LRRALWHRIPSCIRMCSGRLYATQRSDRNRACEWAFSSSPENTVKGSTRRSRVRCISRICSKISALELNYRHLLGPKRQPVHEAHWGWGQMTTRNGRIAALRAAEIGHEDRVLCPFGVCRSVSAPENLHAVQPNTSVRVPVGILVEKFVSVLYQPTSPCLQISAPKRENLTDLIRRSVGKWLVIKASRCDGRFTVSEHEADDNRPWKPKSPKSRQSCARPPSAARRQPIHDLRLERARQDNPVSP